MTDLLSAGEPRVVPTTALGYRFRSTTEARWAILLRSLRIDFEYEPETYDLGTLGWYLPDFWLTQLGCHLEVKSSRPLLDVEYDKARALFLLTQQPVLIAQGFGRPPWGELHSHMSPERWPGQIYDVWTSASPLPSAGAGGNNHHLAVCTCGRIELSYGGYGTTCGRRPGHGWDVARLDAAYDEATSFRPDGRG